MWNEIEFELCGELPDDRLRSEMEEGQLLIYRMVNEDPIPLFGLPWEDLSIKLYALLPEGSYGLDFYWNFGPEVWKLDAIVPFEVDTDGVVDIDLSESHMDDIQGAP